MLSQNTTTLVLNITKVVAKHDNFGTQHNQSCRKILHQSSILGHCLDIMPYKKIVDAGIKSAKIRVIRVICVSIMRNVS